MVDCLSKSVEDCEKRVSPLSSTFFTRRFARHGMTLLLLTSWFETSLSFSTPRPSFGEIQKITGKPPTKATPPQDEKPSLDDANVPSPDDETVNAFIRSEYEAWVLQHNKTADDERFQIFKGNFLATLKAYETTGKYHALNKYADMTPEEYKKEPAQVDEVDAYVRAEYKAWLEQYGKTYNEKRFAVFKENFLMTMKIFEETGKFNALNEHGDMTREEFLRMQTKLSMAASKQQSSGAQSQTGGWDGNPYSSIPPVGNYPSAPSYPRSSGMTFTPVTPRSTSDVLNNGSSKGASNEWGVGASSNEWGGSGGWDAQSYAPPSFGPTRPPAPPSPDSYSSYQYSRPESMTFTPITPRSTSDVLKNGSSGGGSYGNEWGGRDSRSSSRDEWWIQDSTPPRGPPMYPSPAPSYAAPAPDPYSSSQFSRPSGMTFTPVTPRSSSDLLNNGSSSSSSGEWWAQGGSSSPMVGPPMYPSSAPAYSPSPMPYKPSNPDGATFRPISQTSSSDMRNRSNNDRQSNGSPSSYTAFSGSRNDKKTFSYMPKSPSDGRPSPPLNGLNGGSLGKANSNAFMQEGQAKSSKGKGNDSLWDKMASAVEALASGTKPSAYSSLNSSKDKASNSKSGSTFNPGLGP